MADTPLLAVVPPQGEVNPLQRATRRTCACGCGKPLHGKHTRWHSEAHRWKAWDKAHPRQRPLDFDAPSGWTPAQRELSAHLRKRDSRKARMLARLRQGEATTWELMALGGSGWRSRLHELKLDGHPYSCENRLDYAVYRLEAKP